MEAIWNWDGRYLVSAVVALAGMALVLRAVAETVKSWHMHTREPGKNLRWIRGFRGAIQGACLLTAAAGWAFQLPVLIALAGVVALEETIECSLVSWALKQEVEEQSRSQVRPSGTAY